MEPIAIIGMGCRFPGASDLDSFWKLISNGLDAIDSVPSDRWDRNKFFDPALDQPGTAAHKGGFLQELDTLDANFFEISEAEVSTIDPYQSLALEVVWESLENAGIPPEGLAVSQTGVFLGMSQVAQNHRIEADSAGLDTGSRNSASLYLTANRLSHFLKLQGPSLTIDTACSSALVAVHLACQSLRTQECNVAITGGIALQLSPRESLELSARGMLSSQGCCKTFDADADGYVKSEGCGILVLKRLSDAIQDRNTIAAIIKGSAVNHNGLSQGITAPNGLAQQTLIRQALNNASVAPQTVSFVETHGTASVLGDAIEFRAIKSVLMEGRSPEQPCWLGSVKTNIGHLEAASGIAGLIKVVLAVQHQEIPPTLHLQKLNPLISLKDTTFSIPTQRQVWPATSAPRVAGVSAFGIGGTNCHVVLEEAPVVHSSSGGIERPLQIFTLSAKTPTALESLVFRYLEYLKHRQNNSIADICFSANTGRSHFEHRLAIMTESVPDLCRQLEASVAIRERQPHAISNFSDVAQPNENWQQTLQQLKVQYLSGASIDWVDFYKDSTHNRLTLPNYPFQRQRYWVWQSNQNLTLSFTNQNHAFNQLPLNGLKPQKPEQLHSAITKPRTLTEEMLAQIWADALEIESIQGNEVKSHLNIYTNFFELGGHSLSVAHLLTQIQTVFQIDLPIHSFFEDPTIAGLASVIEAQQQYSYRSSADSPWFSLVPLQSGGSQRAVFLIPGGIGDEDTLMTFARLIFFLGQSRPIFGFKINDWNTPSTVEAIAADFIREMRKIQPEGPYILVGECIGGLIALKIAQQLKIEQQSTHLCLLDSPLSKITKLYSYFTASFLVPVKDSLQFLNKVKGSKDKLIYVQTKIRGRFKSLEQKNKTKRIQEIQRKYIKTLIQYKPKVFHESITLILSKNNIAKNYLKRDWIRAGCSEHNIYEVNGDHESYLGKYVQSTANVLKGYFDKVSPPEESLSVLNSPAISVVKD